MPRKSVSPNGKSALRPRTIYFSDSEWAAIREKAYLEDRKYTDIVREAIRTQLQVRKKG